MKSFNLSWTDEGKITDSNGKSYSSAEIAKILSKSDITDQLAFLSGLDLTKVDGKFKNFDDFCSQGRNFLHKFESFSTSAPIGLFERKGKVVYNLLMGHHPLTKLKNGYSRTYIHLPRTPFMLLKEPHNKTRDRLFKKNVVIFDDCIHQGKNTRKTLRVLNKIHSKVLCFSTLLILEETLDQLEKEFPQVTFKYLVKAKDENEFSSVNLNYIQRIYKLYPPPLDENHLVLNFETDKPLRRRKLVERLKKNGVNVGGIVMSDSKGVSSVGIPSCKRISVEIRDMPRDIPKFMLVAIKEWTVRISCIKNNKGYEWYLWGYLSEMPFKCTGTSKCQSELKVCFKGLYVEEDNCLECYQFYISLGMTDYFIDKLEAIFKKEGIKFKLKNSGWLLLEGAEYLSRQKMLRKTK